MLIKNRYLSSMTVAGNSGFWVGLHQVCALSGRSKKSGLKTDLKLCVRVLYFLVFFGSGRALVYIFGQATSFGLGLYRTGPKKLELKTDSNLYVKARCFFERTQTDPAG